MWRKVPLARLLLPLSCGILSASIHPAAGWIDDWLVPTLVLLWLLLSPWLLRGQSRRYRFLFGIGVFGWLYLAGAALYWQSSTEGRVVHPLRDGATQLFHGRIAEVTERPGKGPRVRFWLRANGPHRDSLFSNRQWILVYFPEGSQVTPGQWLLLSGQVGQVADPKNPGNFNYRSYLFFQGIRYRVFARHIWYLPLNSRSIWASRMHTLRQRIRTRVLAGMSRPEVKGVALALLMGDKRELHDDLRADYARSGAMHVLAVSGLHVGIVAMILGGFCRLFRLRGQLGRTVPGIISLLGVWLFAGISGASPSVMRAALMFSLLIIGRWRGRRGDIWNSLMAAAFLLLWWQPLLLFQLSFQLSFVAVAGIVFFHPLLQKAVFFPQPALQYFWSLLGVGIAAQCATAPLTIHHFHQFPLLFWVSGWIVIPLATAILVLGLLKGLLLDLPVVGDLLTWSLRSVIQLMNGAMSYLANQPWAVWEGMDLPVSALFLLYATLMALILGYREWPALARWSGWPCMLALIISLHTYWATEHQRAIMVYHTRDRLFLDILIGRRANRFFDGEQSALDREFADQGLRQKIELRVVQENPLPAGAHVTFRGWDQHVLWLRSEWSPPRDATSWTVIVISTEAVRPADFNRLRHLPEIIVLSPGLSPRSRAEWQDHFPDRCWDTGQDGAFYLPLNKPFHERSFPFFSV